MDIAWRRTESLVTVATLRMRERPALLCATTLALVAAATVVALPLQDRIDGSAFVVFVVAVMVATWAGGLATGLATTALSAASLDYLVLPPRFAFEPTDPAHLTRLAGFVLAALIVGTLHDATRRAQLNAERLAAERADLLSRERAVRDELEGTVEELQAANAVKDEFLAMVSHEIKTPIAIITVDAELLRRHADATTVDVEIVDEIVSEGGHLSQIIDNLLVLSRTGRAGVAAQPTPLRDLVDRVTLRHLAQYPARRVVVDVDGRTVVAAQPLLCEQVVGNLLSNAEKYSPSDTTIEITATTRDQRSVVCVADRGYGITAEEAQDVFRAVLSVTADGRDVTGAGARIGCLQAARRGASW